MGVRGHALPENFDFNSSKMTGNAFKITNEMFNLTPSVLFLLYGG